MEFISEEERQAHVARRTELYNQIQMVVAGHDPLAAISAMCDALAVAAVQISGADRAASHKLLDGLLEGMKRTADNNLDLVAEQRANPLFGAASNA